MLGKSKKKGKRETERGVEMKWKKKGKLKERKE